MKVLVTGMMGRIGSRLPGPLQEAGFLVRGMDLKAGGDIFDTKSPYGLSKKTAAGYAALYNVLYGLDVVTLALSNVYGPGMGGVVGEFLADWERVDAEGGPVGGTLPW